jgi:hypothetical protein
MIILFRAHPMKLSNGKDALFSAVCALLLFAVAFWGTVSLIRHGDRKHPNKLWRGAGWHSPLFEIVVMTGLLGFGFGLRSASKWRGTSRNSTNTSKSKSGVRRRR